MIFYSHLINGATMSISINEVLYRLTNEYHQTIEDRLCYIIVLIDNVRFIVCVGMYSISKHVSFVMFRGPYVEDLWRRRKSWPQFMQNACFNEICASLIIKGNIRPHISYKARHTHTHMASLCVPSWLNIIYISLSHTW